MSAKNPYGDISPLKALQVRVKNDVISSQTTKEQKKKKDDKK